MQKIVADQWSQYSLLDAGCQHRLEKFGGVIIAKPDPNAIWQQSSPESTWDKAEAFYTEKHWEAPDYLQSQGWRVSYQHLQFILRLTPFRHVGIFPEQSANWQWLSTLPLKGRRVLNLFGYTGAASIVAAAAGAEVTHVDASKSSVAWAAENARLNGLSCRWIVDDVRKFVQREVKRGAKYDLIMMDPPVFGRGTKGEIWRLHDNLEELIKDCSRLFSNQPLAFLINFYATEIYPEAIVRLIEQQLSELPLNTSLSGLYLREESTKKLLQTGYLIRGELAS